MSGVETELVKKLVETFVQKADEISRALVELRVAFDHFNQEQRRMVEKLDALMADLKTLIAKFEMAIRR